MQYLNSRPLIDAYDGKVVYDHPAALAGKLHAGELDVALCPSFELFAHPESYYAIDGVAIVSKGAVYSVFLAYLGKIENLRRVALDRASLTSIHLARCLLERHRPREIEWVDDPESADARVLIGNQAIRFRQSAGPEWSFLDFGEEWERMTGLPFVYALWLMREDTPGARQAADELRAIKRAGLVRLGTISQEGDDLDPGFCLEYLTRYIHFDLGAEEKGGLWEFGRTLQELGLAPRAPMRPIFI